MSKKMKIFTAGALGIMMAGLVCTNVYALDNKDVVGTWYANSLSMDGMNEFHPNAIMMEMSMEISEDGKGKVTTSSESEEASTSLSEDFSGLDEVSLAMVPSEVAGDSSVEDSSESEESFASDEASERFKETYSLWETGSKSLSRSKSSSSDSVKSLSVREIFLLQ